MEKEAIIIELLKNKDIKYVTGITIRLEIDKADYLRIDYLNDKGQAKMIVKKF